MFKDNRVVRDTGATYPIFQAPMTWIARGQLVSAVSAAGGLGLLEGASADLEMTRREIGLIRERHGLISVITHPDYLLGERERDLYEDLLRYLVELREHHAVWVAQPGEINRWWRNRHQMKLVKHGDAWQIEGQDSDRARVAYATLFNDRPVYKVDGVNVVQPANTVPAREEVV